MDVRDGISVAIIFQTFPEGVVTPNPCLLDEYY